PALRWPLTQATEKENDMTQRKSRLTSGVLVLTIAALGAIASSLPTAAKAATPRLVATVGPGYTINVRTAAGAPVRSVRAGLVPITVRDRSAEHDFHLSGPGVNKSTTVDWVGTKTWRVRVAPGKTYRFACDPHAAMMHGSFRGRLACVRAGGGLRP